MKLSKIAALFMVPVLALCLVACSAPGGNASESAGSDSKIAELTAQKPANADEAAELYAKLMQKENEIIRVITRCGKRYSMRQIKTRQ